MAKCLLACCLFTLTAVVVSVTQLDVHTVPECYGKFEGDKVQRQGFCSVCTCNGIDARATCDVCGPEWQTTNPQKGCYVVEGDNSLAYPDCCKPRVMCAEGKDNNDNVDTPVGVEDPPPVESAPGKPSGSDDSKDTENLKRLVVMLTRELDDRSQQQQ